MKLDECLIEKANEADKIIEHMNTLIIDMKKIQNKVGLLVHTQNKTVHQIR